MLLRAVWRVLQGAQARMGRVGRVWVWSSRGRARARLVAATRVRRTGARTAGARDSCVVRAKPVCGQAQCTPPPPPPGVCVGRHSAPSSPTPRWRLRRGCTHTSLATESVRRVGTGAPGRVTRGGKPDGVHNSHACHRFLGTHHSCLVGSTRAHSHDRQVRARRDPACLPPHLLSAGGWHPPTLTHANLKTPSSTWQHMTANA